MRYKRRKTGWVLGLLLFLAAAVLCGFLYRDRLMPLFARARYALSSDHSRLWEEEAAREGLTPQFEEYYFEHLTEEQKETYRELYVRLMRYEDKADLYSRIGTEEFWEVYFAVLNDHPEIFWTGPSAQVSESGLTGRVMQYEIETTVPVGQRETLREQMDQAVLDCMAWLWPEATDYEKIKTVYEYLIETVDYDPAAQDSQNAQSALLYHRSVCAGYSRAFQYILHKLGLFCTYLTGTTSHGGEHGWNLVRLDGSYYYVDVTWGDPVFVGKEDGSGDGTGGNDAAAGMGMNYNYLCCSEQELFRTHIPSDTVALPSCDSDAYNYYRLRGLYYETFDWNVIYDRLMQSVWNEEDSITMKFGSAQAYEEAKDNLFRQGMLQDAAEYLMEINGVRSWNYRYYTEDDFLAVTIVWK